jgi:hypothetical protein
MTVKQLIDRLQRNFAPEQEVFVADKPTVSYTMAKPVGYVTEDAVGHTKDGKCFVSALGPDACVLWEKH